MLKKKESYKLLPKLDVNLNAIVHNPEKDNSDVAYSALEKKVNVNIIAPDLKAPIQYVSKLAEGFYSGKVPVEYLKELAYREDIASIHSLPQQVSFPKN